MEPNALFFSLFFSMVGIGFFAYGKKNNFYFLCSGIVLMAYPYFVSNKTVMLSLGVIFMLAPFILNWLFPQR